MSQQARDDVGAASQLYEEAADNDNNNHALTHRRKSTSGGIKEPTSGHNASGSLNSNLKTYAYLQTIASIDDDQKQQTNSTELHINGSSPRIIPLQQAEVLQAVVEESKNEKCRKNVIGPWALLQKNRVLLSRCITWLLCFALLFGVVWAIFGPQDGLPGGRMFSLAALYTVAVLFGWAAEALGLPPLLGMLLAGLALGNIPAVKIVGRSMQPEWGSALRTIALAILLLRAGLGLDARALRSLKYYVVALGVTPAVIEIAAYTVLSHFMLGFAWLWGLLVGFVLAPVSAAIIVPGMLLLQEQGLGASSGIPTLTMAAASVDNIVGIVGFGITLGFVFVSNSSLAWKIGQGPLGVAVGIAYGVVVGAVLWFVPDRRGGDQVALFRFGLLLGLGVLAIFGAQRADLSGAGALGCLTLAFVSGIGWRRNASAADLLDVVKVSALFSRLWLAVFQPLLFALIGAAVAFDVIDWYTVPLGIPLLIAALVARACATLAVLTRSGLTWREKAFVCIAWMSKASVQAAVGSMALDTAHRLNSPDAVVNSGLKVLTLAVLAIVVTAPLGAIGLKWGATKLLKPSAVVNAVYPSSGDRRNGEHNSAV